MKKNDNRKNRHYLKLLGVVCASILFFALVTNLGQVLDVLGVILRVLMPFLLGLAIAFIINMPLRFFERKVFRKLSRKKLWRKIKRPVCLLLSWLSVLAAFLIIFSLILPSLVRTLEEFFRSLPSYMDHLNQTVSDWIDRYDLPLNKDSINIDWATISSKALELLHSQSSNITNVTIEILVGFFSGLANLLIGFVFSIYVLASKESLGKLCKSILYAHFKKERAQGILSVCSLSGKAFSGFISGQCTEAVLIGFLCFIGMKIFQFPHAMLVSCLISVTALVPIFGAIAGGVLGALLILLVNPLQALLFLIFIIVLQQIESNVVYPKIMGKSVGLPGIWVLVAVTVGGNLGGILGMVFSVPAVSVLFTLYERWIRKRLAERNIHKKMLVIETDEPVRHTPGQTHIDFENPDHVAYDKTEEDEKDSLDWDDNDWINWEHEPDDGDEDDDPDPS